MDEVDQLRLAFDDLRQALYERVAGELVWRVEYAAVIERAVGAIDAAEGLIDEELTGEALLALRQAVELLPS